MESIWKEKLIEFKNTNSFIEVTFIYPSSTKVAKRNGYVIKVYGDGFEFDDRFDGLTSYSFQWVTSIKEVSVDGIIKHKEGEDGRKS